MGSKSTRPEARPCLIERQKVTLGDVARAAEVSPATVSRALNTPNLVRADVRERIAETISALGYVPNGAARALASRRSFTLGAVVPTLANAIFVDTIDAFQRRLEQSGYVMLLATSDYDSQHEFKRAKALIERGVDGLMLVGHRHRPALMEVLEQYRLPFVETWGSQSPSGWPAVGYDSREAGELVIRYLLSLQHREFAVIMDHPDNNERMAARLAGMKRALRARKVGLPPQRTIFVENSSIGEGRRAVQKLLAFHDLATAIVCGNDVLAVGALLECQRQGMAVPDQLSITGFGDVELAAEIAPGLTTVRSPRGQIGHLAAEYLLARIDGRPAEIPPPLGLELVVRGTTAAPSA